MSFSQTVSDIGATWRIGLVILLRKCFSLGILCSVSAAKRAKFEVTLKRLWRIDVGAVAGVVFIRRHVSVCLLVPTRRIMRL